ncbi:MAG: hypothetical protein GY928_33980 [Colwellia sp.]|nr:hypothetical protein [Colwellia sp.]
MLKVSKDGFEIDIEQMDSFDLIVMAIITLGTLTVSCSSISGIVKAFIDSGCFY